MRIFITFSFMIGAMVLSPLSWGLPEPAQQASLDLPGNLENFKTVRVLILKKKSQIIVDTDFPYTVYDGDGRVLFSGDKIVNTIIKTAPFGIQMGPQIFRVTPITIRSQGIGVKVNGQLYRSSITILPDAGGTVMAINELDLEDYLRGVLPWEANPVWPKDALKAQAIVSRTYAFFTMLERAQEPYDLSSEVESQVYRGQRIENDKTDQVIRETHGQMLVYDGKIFPAFFHSTCGGATTSAKSLWINRAHPALQGVLCPFCEGTKHSFWENSFSESQMVDLFQKKGYSVKSIAGIDAVDFDSSGRAQNFLIRTGDKSFKVKANDFRIWMDPGKFKSTKIERIEKINGQFKFSGKGWGHGVGMCQYGMKGMAEKKYDYKQILNYYFPGSYIIQTKV